MGKGFSRYSPAICSFLRQWRDVSPVLLEDIRESRGDREYHHVCGPGRSGAIKKSPTERSNRPLSFCQSLVTVERNPVDSVFPIFNCSADYTANQAQYQTPLRLEFSHLADLQVYDLGHILLAVLAINGHSGLLVCAGRKWQSRKNPPEDFPPASLMYNVWLCTQNGPRIIRNKEGQQEWVYSTRF